MCPRSGSREVPIVNERLDRVDQKVEIQISPPAAQLWMLERRILGQPLSTHVRNADDYRVQTVETHFGHCNVYVPRAGKARGGIKQILAVVHVDDGILAIPGRVSAG